MSWGVVAWTTGELGSPGGVGTHSGNARFLVVAHAPVYCSYDEDVFSLGLTIKQGGGGDFTCRREGCMREDLGGPRREQGRRERTRHGGREEGVEGEVESMKERCSQERPCLCVCCAGGW